jgi:hypothetical protein
MKKTILISIILTFWIYIFFTKLDFLFFKVKICNNTNTNLYTSIIYNDYDDLLQYYSHYMIYGSYNSDKIIYFSTIKQWECSNYKNIHRLDYGFWIKGISYKYIKWKEVFQNEYYWWILWDKIWKMWFWEYTYNIEKIENIDNDFKWVLYLEEGK